MALPVFPTIANGGLMAATNESWPQFYIDYANGTDGAGVAGSRAAPWKTFDVAFNSRLGAGGSHDRNGQPCIINLRNTTEHYFDVAAGTNKSLGSSATTVQSRGGTLSQPWVVRTDPLDAANAAQDSSSQAWLHIHLTFNSSMYYTRFERVRLGGPNVTAFDNPQGAGCSFVQLFYCSMHHMVQNGPQWISNALQVPKNCGTWGCSIHDGGNDTGIPASPHDHGIYVGSGPIPGADDCFAINCVIYRMTGSGIQWYEKATRMLVAHCTIDEICWPPLVSPKGGIFVGAESYGYSRDSLVVNTLFSTIPAGANNFAIYTDDNSGTWPSTNINAAHHNGYYVNTITPEDTSQTPNSITYGGNNVSANALYVNLAGHNYRLQVGSPMIGAGDPAYKPATDFDGNPFVTTDIGAFANQTIQGGAAAAAKGGGPGAVIGSAHASALANFQDISRDSDLSKYVKSRGHRSV